MHQLDALPGVIDVRALGLIAGIEFAANPNGAAYAAQIFAKCFDDGVLVRPAGNTIALSPPLVISEAQIAQIVESIARAARAVVQE